jgi:hypothetical protein
MSLFLATWLFLGALALYRLGLALAKHATERGTQVTYGMLHSWMHGFFVLVIEVGTSTLSAALKAHVRGADYAASGRLEFYAYRFAFA